VSFLLLPCRVSPICGAKTVHDSRRCGSRGQTSGVTIYEVVSPGTPGCGSACGILMRKLLPCFLLVSVAALSIILKADDEVIESIVARVNNQIITHSEYLRSKEELKKEAQQQDPVNADKFVTDHDKDVL